MINLDLDLNEVVVLESTDVCTDGFISSNSDDLYLTNFNIIYVRYNFWGKIKSVDKFQLSEIKMFNGAPHVTMVKNSDGTYELQIYLKSEQISFTFVSGKRTISKWITTINQLVNGNYDQASCNKNLMAIPGTEQVAETIKDTVSKFKSSLGIQRKTENVTIKCLGCGAILSGEKGSLMRCEYCDTIQTL